MNDVVLAGAALLFLVGCIVRILPSVLPVKLSEQARGKIQTILPVAVLINLLVYCVVSESGQHRFASLAGFAVAALLGLIMLRRHNLLLMVAAATASYLVLR